MSENKTVAQQYLELQRQRDNAQRKMDLIKVAGPITNEGFTCNIDRNLILIQEGEYEISWKEGNISHNEEICLEVSLDSIAQFKKLTKICPPASKMPTVLSDERWCEDTCSPYIIKTSNLLNKFRCHVYYKVNYMGDEFVVHAIINTDSIDEEWLNVIEDGRHTYKFVKNIGKPIEDKHLEEGLAIYAAKTENQAIFMQDFLFDSAKG